MANMEDALRLYVELQEETDYMRRKQQRKGVEYRMKESPSKGDLGIAALTNTKRSSSPGEDSRSPRNGDNKGSTQTLGGSLKGTLKGDKSLKSTKGGKEQQEVTNDGTVTLQVDLDEYDPKALAEKEAAELAAAVSRAREEASDLHHKLLISQRQRDDLHSELVKLEFEDNVENDRAEGMQKVNEAKNECDDLTRQLNDTEAYKLTLEYMMSRCRKTKVDSNAVQKAFEDALAVHHHELKLKQQLLESVIKSKDAEVAELLKMQDEAKKQLADLDKKLESRRAEVRVRQEKARWRLQKLEQEMSLSAHVVGTLTPEEEKILIDQAKSLAAESAEVRQIKMKLQADADNAEAEYHRLRFAAGILMEGEDETAGPGAKTATRSKFEITTKSHHDDTGSADGEGDEAEEAELYGFIAPDPDAIVSRLSQLEVEMRQVEDQVEDYTQRLKVLQSRNSQLASIKQPKARDDRDELDTDVTEIDRLKKRAEEGKRSLAVSKQELKRAEQTKLQLQQSISLLARRLDYIAAPLPEAPRWDSLELEEDEDAVRRLVSADEHGLPTEWCVDLSHKLVKVVDRIQMFHRVIDFDGAVAAYHEARVWLEQTFGSHSPLGPQSRNISTAATPSFRLGAPPISEVEATEKPALLDASEAAALSTPAATDSHFETPSLEGQNRRAMESRSKSMVRETAPGMRLMRKASSAAYEQDERELETAIDTIITANEYGIRVRPNSGHMQSSNQSNKSTGLSNTFNNAKSPAVQAKLLSEAATAFEKTLTDGPTIALASSKTAAEQQQQQQQQEQGNKSTLTRRPSRMSAKSGSRDGVSAVDGEDDGSSSKGMGLVQPIARPRPRELHRLLASALQMSGDDVDDYVVGGSQKRETEEVVTREQLKRTTKVHIRQLRKREGHKAKSAAAGAGGNEDEA